MVDEAVFDRGTMTAWAFRWFVQAPGLPDLLSRPGQEMSLSGAVLCTQEASAGVA